MRPIEEWIRELASPAPERQDNARRELRAHGAEALPTLLSAFREPGAPWKELSELLLGLGPAARPGLVDALQDPKPQVRARAAWTLGQMENPSPILAVAPLLADPDSSVRRQAIEVLTRCAAADCVPILCEALESEDDWVRRRAAVGLEALRDPRAVHPLRARLSDGDPGVRLAAARALGEIGDVRALESLVAALASADSRLKAEAAEALGKLRHPAAVGPLCRALIQRDLLLQTRASDALVRIGASAAQPLCSLLTVQDRIVLETVVRLGPAAIPFLLNTLRKGKPQARRAAAWALGELAVQRPVPELRAALPLLQRKRRAFWQLGEEELVDIYQVARERIEKATANLQHLPLPAAAPPPSRAALPLPAAEAHPSSEGLPRPAAPPPEPPA